VYKKAELNRNVDSENNHGGSSRTYVLHRAGCSQEDDQLLRQGCERSHQANLEGVVPVCHLAGGYSLRIHKARLCRTYRADSVSDLSFCVRNGFGEVRGVACPATQGRTHCWLLHTECSSVSLVARDFSPA